MFDNCWVIIKSYRFNTLGHTFEFCLNVFTEFCDKILNEKLFNLQPLVQETKLLPQNQKDTDNRQDS